MPGTPSTTRAGTRPTTATRAGEPASVEPRAAPAEATQVHSPTAKRAKQPASNAASSSSKHAGGRHDGKIKGVDVADVGDALAGGLRVTAETLVWLVWNTLLGLRAAAVATSRAWTVAWPTLQWVFPRFAWWAALAVLFVGGTTLLDAFAPAERFAWLPLAFAIGLGLAVIPAFLARAGHLRVFGVALAAAHASALLLVWMVQAG